MNITEIYKKFNYPSKNKLYQIAKREGIKTSLKEIDEFLKKQATQQIYTNVKRKPGFITALQPYNKIQMDLIDMTKFSNTNNGYGWIYIIIDIFTRKIFTYLNEE